MTKRVKTQVAETETETPPAPPEYPYAQLTPELVGAIVARYDEQKEDRMGNLHNQLVAFLSASQLPLVEMLMAIEIVKLELVEQARQKYLGE